MSNANFEDGMNASVAIQKTIVRLMREGLDPRSISLVTASIGAAMLVEHYGRTNGPEISKGLVEKAVAGELETYPALKTANQNVEPS